MLRCPTCGKHYPSDVHFCPEDQSALQADPTVVGEASVDPLIGVTLDEKYRIEQRLGVGGMGTVYRARHVLIDRPVALKVLNQRLVEDEASRVRFQRESGVDHWRWNRGDRRRRARDVVGEPETVSTQSVRIAFG